jgi:2-oxo-3-hexenedioate decarboxylase
MERYKGGVTMNLSPEAAELLDRVRRARTERRVMKSDPSSEVSLEEAYLIRAELRGDREIAGYKLGLLSPAKQAQMGIEAPIFGAIYSDMLLSSPVSLGRFIQPRFEPEVAVVLNDDVRSGASPAKAGAAVGEAVLGVDFLDSVWEGYRFGVSEVVADNASGGGFLLGDRPLSKPFDGRLYGQLRMYLDGELVSEGSLQALGDVGERLSWLAEEIGRLSDGADSLEAGQLVFLGSPAAALEARPGTLGLRGPEDSVLVAELVE